MKGLHSLTFLLLAIGGLNWLLIGVFQWGIGDFFGGDDMLVSRILYILVGISALYEIATHKGICRLCSGGGKQ